MFLLIDKPKGITSHDVVDAVRKVTGEKKVGHAGTLDPNATGLVIVGVGRQFTKKLGSIAKDTTKDYLAEVFLGEVRDTDDVDGEILWRVRKSKSGGNPTPDLPKVKDVLDSFVGEQKQMPPIYSAIKLKGKKAYELARKGKTVVLEPRKVVIHSIKLVKYKFPTLEFTTTVSSGTYIRSLARDIGESLGAGAYLANLRRTKIGEFTINESVKLAKLTKDNWKSFGRLD